MVDIQTVRNDPELIKTKTAQKGYKVDIDRLLEVDSQRKELQAKTDELRQRRNENAERMKSGKPEPAAIEEGRRIKAELEEAEAKLEKVDNEFVGLLSSIPNPASDDVPVGGEEDSVEIKVVGGKPVGAQDHLDYAVSRDWVDFERGAKVAGAKFYYLKGELVLLENAITQYALDFVMNKGFGLLTVPHLVSSRIAVGAGFAPRGDKEGNEYYVEGEDLSLIGTAEIPLTGFHADEIIDEADLPKLYAALSPCYRREAGTYGKHARGLFRVHQFNKLEMYVFCLPEKSIEMHERILAIEEELWASLGVPYHVINIASGDLGAPAVKKYDIEYWSKADGHYRELTSCSNCTDFQARNLNIRVRRSDGRIEPLHTLNGTAVSLARSLVVVLEHFQNGDGTLTVPEVLRKYIGGKEKV